MVRTQGSGVTLIQDEPMNHVPAPANDFYCEYAAGACDQDLTNLQTTTGVLLYPSIPRQIAATIEAAVPLLRQRSPGSTWKTWREFGITGQIIFCSICKNMRSADVIIADVTTLNFNLLFEVGYAIGLLKALIPIRDTTIETSQSDFRDLGLLDTIGYLDFQNAESLARGILERLPVLPLPPSRVDLNRESPLYLLKAHIATEGDVRLNSTSRNLHFAFAPSIQSKRHGSRYTKHVGR